MAKKTPKPSEAFINASRTAADSANHALDAATRKANADYLAKRRAANEKFSQAQRALEEAHRAELSIVDGLRNGAISTAKGNHAAARKLRLEITGAYHTTGDEATAIAALASLATE